MTGNATIRPPCVQLTLHGAWHCDDVLMIRTRTLLGLLLLGEQYRPKKKKATQKSRWSHRGKMACVGIYRLINQYGFSYTKRPSCHGRGVSVTSTWSWGAVARSSLIASCWLVRATEWRGWQPSHMRNITYISHAIHGHWPWPWLSGVI